MTGMDVLERPLYAYGDVDRILGLPSGTARRWIDGYGRRGVFYEPVIRCVPQGQDALVTWGEFVETYYLARLRNHSKPVPFPRIRRAMERLRERWDVAYVFAHERVLYADREDLEVVKAIQEEEEIEGFLVEVLRTGQLSLILDARTRLERIEFDAGIATRLRPRLDIDTVYVEGSSNFGRPTIIGTNITPRSLAELVQAGDSVELISELYEVPEALVHDAGRFVYGSRWRLAAA